MNNSCPFGPNLVSSCWAIAKPATGLKATALHLSSGLTVSVSWLACEPNILGPSNKGIAKTPSVKVFFRLRKQLLSDPPLGTLTLPRTNIGFSSKLFMASVRAHVTGTTRSVPYFAPLVSLPVRMTLVFTRVLRGIRKILPALSHPNLFCTRDICG